MKRRITITMSTSFAKDIQKDIRDHTFKKVYLLTGDEGYLIHQVRLALIKALLPEGDTMNYHPYELDRVDIREISDLALSFPFFSEKRVIVLDTTGIIKDGKEELLALFDKLPDSTCMILIEEKVDKRSSVYKWIKKKGYVVEAKKEDLTEGEMKKYIAGWLKRAGKKISARDASFLVDRVGKDLYRLNAEVCKLIAYSGEREEIGQEDILALVPADIEDKIFELTEAIAAGNHDLVKIRYREMILLKEPPLRILYMMTRQYRIMTIVCDMTDRRIPDKEIAGAAGIRDFVVRKNRALLRGYDVGSLEEILDSCLETENRIKSGLIGDRIGLEELLFRLTDRISS